MGVVNDYDVIVIGGGSAGTSAARAASHAGARTLMINDGELGGLCILRGCMPSKVMLASAHAVDEAHRLEEFGVHLEGRVVPDFARIMERKETLVRRFQRSKIRSIEAQDYEVLIGRARFASGGVVEVGERRLRAGAYVIATGSVPSRIDLPGIADVPVITSDDVMALATPPRSLLIQGAGPIGLELAQFFSRIGTRVLLVNRSPLLSRYDPECGAELGRVLEREPRLSTAIPGGIERLGRRGAGLVAIVVDAEGRRVEFEADALLMATGRRAALDDLGLAHVGLGLVEGRIEHDASMRTSNPAVYVAGDAAGNHQVLHLANQEGTVAGHNAAGKEPAERMDYRLQMTVIFTDPPFASVGASEADADGSGPRPVVGRARFPETGRAITMNVHFGLWKLLVDPRTGEVLGSSILGPRADDLVHLISTAMHFEARIEELCALPWYHPTLSEVILNLGRDIAAQRGVPCETPGAATLPPGYSSSMGRASRGGSA